MKINNPFQLQNVYHFFYFLNKKGAIRKKKYCTCNMNNNYVINPQSLNRRPSKRMEESEAENRLLSITRMLFKQNVSY